MTAWAIEVAGPERFFRLSLVGATWQECRRRVRQVRYDLRREFPGWEDCFNLERNPRQTGIHAHGLQHSAPYVPQRRLQRLCERRGLGIPYIGLWKPTSGRAYGYGLKEATGYGMKGAQTVAGLEAYLDLNGGRFVHSSRGFWRDAQTGQRLAGVKAARRLAMERRYGDRSYKAEDWVRMRAEVVDGY